MLNVEDITLPGGQLRWCPQAVPEEAATDWFSQVRREVSWQTETLKMYGREIAVPRLIAWHGDSDARYRYSGVLHEPEPWGEPLGLIRQWVQNFSGHQFNSVLANLYRDGADAMGWHADNEPELGDEPVIASLSLGATRRMRFRRADRPSTSQARKGHDRLHLDLTHGSVLLMTGQTQNHWQHAITRTRRPVGERINLTFRTIVTPATSSPARKSDTRRQR